MNSSDSNYARRASAIGGVGAVLVAILLLLLLTSSVQTVPAGFAGVKTRFNKVMGKSLPSGLHFKLPWVDRITEVEVREQKFTLDTSASSRDLQTVQSKIVVNFHPLRDKVHSLFDEVGLRYEERVLAPAVEETVKAVTAQFTADELISKRTQARNDMEGLLRERMAANHLAITKFNIVNFEFSKAFNDAIEAKQTVEQEALRAENDLERIKVEAQQRIEEARGQAEAIKLKAQADGEAIAIKSEAEAKAHEILSKYISTEVIQLRAIEKWDGIMPRVTGEAVPLLNLDPKTTGN